MSNQPPAGEYNTDQLELHLQQITNHLAGSDPRSSPQSREVQGAREGIGKAEEQHGWDPAARILQRKARSLHAVLLNLAAAEMVHAASGIDLGREFTGHVCQLCALENVEVVIGGVSACVAFGADGGTCYNVLVNRSRRRERKQKRGKGKNSPKMIKYSVIPTRKQRSAERPKEPIASRTTDPQTYWRG